MVERMNELGFSITKLETTQLFNSTIPIIQRAVQFAWKELIGLGYSQNDILPDPIEVYIANNLIDLKTIGVCITTPCINDITVIYVDEAFQRKGVGRSLIQHATHAWNYRMATCISEAGTAIMKNLGVHIN